MSSPNIVENVNQCQNCEALLAVGLKEPVTQPQPVSGQTSALAPLLSAGVGPSLARKAPIISPRSPLRPLFPLSLGQQQLHNGQSGPETGYRPHAAGRTPQYLVLRSDAKPQLQQSQLKIFYFKDSVNFMHAMRID